MSKLDKDSVELVSERSEDDSLDSPERGTVRVRVQVRELRCPNDVLTVGRSPWSKFAQMFLGT
jgi:hypothetical protein